ncbi:hypothetical protein OB919_16230 [Halobacteria archaeon AArc-curdl1]|uniref:GvpH protein n=1 Tax=Natronosalvus hydrolyticus TaxID=2979988 RepID=A0AAP2ZAM9_9EURY|nr:hypothetical protein [Halobacteria archaeon AArc-curdl1]
MTDKNHDDRSARNGPDDEPIDDARGDQPDDRSPERIGIQDDSEEDQPEGDDRSDDKYPARDTDGDFDSGAENEGEERRSGSVEDGSRERSEPEIPRWLSALRRSFHRLERHQSIDIDVSVGTLLDAIDDPPPSETSVSSAQTRGRQPVRRRPEVQRDRSSSIGVNRGGSSDDVHVSTRATEDQLLLIADAAGIDEDDIVVGFQGEELVLGVDGAEVTRIEVPWEDRSTNTYLRNGILTVLIEPDTND